jgi:hypothetical protein
MNAAERRAFEDLQRQLMEVKDQLRQMSNGEATSQRSKYVLSDADRERRDATRARDAEFARRTGPRPLGGFSQQSSVAATDINFKSGQAFDTIGGASKSEFQDLSGQIQSILDRLDNASGSASLSLNCDESPPTITGSITISI